MTHWGHLFWSLQGVPCITSSSTMLHFLHHFSHYSIALNLIFTAFTYSPTFPHIQSSLPQMEPMPSQVRNHYSQKNQEALLERALTFNNAANLRCPSYVCLWKICHCALCCWWLLSPISLLKPDDNPNQEISYDKGKSEYPGEPTSSSAMQVDDGDHKQKLLLLG
jgi:hypothetical protein